MARRIVLLLSFIVVAGGQIANSQETNSKTPKLTVSKETTFLSGPLTKDGFIDYAAGINQRMSAGVTAENNAVVQYFLAHGPAPEGMMMPERFFKLIGIPMPPVDGDYFLGIGDHLKKIGMLRDDPKWETVIENQGLAASRPWTRDDFPHIALWLDMNSRPLSLVVEGTQRTRYYSPLVGTDEDPQRGVLISALLPGVQLAREYCRALTARAMLNLGEGDIEAAWQDLLSCQRLGRSVAQGPTVIEGLVGIAISGMAEKASLAFLQHCGADAETITRYGRDLEQLAAMPSMADKVDLTERCMLLDCMLLIARGGDGADALGIEAGFPSLRKLIEQRKGSDVDWDTANRVANKWYDRCVAAVRVPEYRQRKEALKEVNEALSNLTRRFRNSVRFAQKLPAEKANGPVIGKVVGEAMVALLLPAVEACQKASDRSIQIDRNLRLAFALAAYHSDTGEYPKDLDELSPKYIDAIPTDLYSGNALQYRPNDEGYLLYSIGANEIDEQGRWHDDVPQGDDPGVRMPRE